MLAGSWSSSSLAMMRSFDINIFLIPFNRICDLLAQYNIDFNWGEKDRITAVKSWNKYAKLKAFQKTAIGTQMIDLVKDDLEAIIVSILDDTIERDVDRISIELHSNIGEVKIREFTTVQDAIDFLNMEALGQVFITTDSLTLFDLPPILGD